MSRVHTWKASSPVKARLTSNSIFITFLGDTQLKTFSERIPSSASLAYPAPKAPQKYLLQKIPLSTISPSANLLLKDQKNPPGFLSELLSSSSLLSISNGYLKTGKENSLLQPSRSLPENSSVSFSPPQLSTLPALISLPKISAASLTEKIPHLKKIPHGSQTTTPAAGLLPKISPNQL